MTADFSTHRPDPDLQRVATALVRAGERAREVARQTGTGIAVTIDGQLQVISESELKHNEAAPPDQAS